MTVSTAQRRRVLMTALQFIDLGVVAACLTFTLVLVSAETTVKGWLSFFEIRLRLGNVLFAITYVLAWNVILRVCGLYHSQRLAPASREVKEIGTAVVVGVMPLVPLRSILDLDALRHGAVEAFGISVFLCLVLERRLLRMVAYQLRARGRNLRQILFVGDSLEAVRMTSLFTRRENLGYRIVKSIDVGHVNGNGREHAENEDAVLARVEAELAHGTIDEVFVSLPMFRSGGLIERLVSLCEQEGIAVRVLSRLADLHWSWASVDSLMGEPVITISPTGPNVDMGGMFAKRVLDVVVSTAALVLLAPVFAAIALAIKLDSRGAIIFAQERVGFNRRRFRVFKFRTMVPDAEARQKEIEHLNEAEGPVFKIQKDPRLTRVGGFLRRTSLDELPQFFNVLRGDMSLVGPRPLPVRDFERIETRWHRRRFSMKPGLTCLWQVTRREPKFDEWIRMDMEYIDNWSLDLDFKILVKTIPAVLSRHGAQ
jgi:exopolysaccharide biosynthesis polyprenyl glycosylphosphotransferase